MPTANQILSPLDLPGQITATSWKLPRSLDEVDWIRCGQFLCRVEGAVQWWIGDWWAYGSEREYGDGVELAQRVGGNYGTLRNYAFVCNNFELSRRRDNLSFGHHQAVCGLSSRREQDRWLSRAEREQLSVGRLRAAIAQSAAAARTRAIEFNARELGKYSLIYADPPWRYDFPPMGGTNRSVENHYPTMTMEDIIALPVRDIAHENAVLFLWATAPLLMKTNLVLEAWGFTYRTNAVWIKDQIGTGYHFRNRHELLLVAKRGELPPPPTEARQDSVIESPRRGHSEKPEVFYDIIELMYPDLTKIELFARNRRRGWKSWGNQVEAITVQQEEFIVEEAAE